MVTTTLRGVEFTFAETDEGDLLDMIRRADLTSYYEHLREVYEARVTFAPADDGAGQEEDEDV